MKTNGKKELIASVVSVNMVWCGAGVVGGAAVAAGGRDVAGGAVGVGRGVRRHRARPGAARRRAGRAAAAQVHAQPARYQAPLNTRSTYTHRLFESRREN
jgi:hypothetical protein